jgi:hypothetical protein
VAEWIESHSSLPRHRKTRRLAKVLGISIPVAVGYIHMLWYYALDFAPGGDLTGHTADDIAAGCMWDGDADEFVEAFITAGLLSRDGRDSLQVHDWDDYSQSHRKRELAAKRQREKRLRDRETTGSSRDVTVTGVTVTPDRQTDRQDKTDKTDRQDKTDTLAPAREAVELFHEYCPSLPKIREVSDSRVRRLAALRKQVGDLAAYFGRVEASDFLTGRTGRWRADLDWITKPEHVLKILEGSYDNRASPSRASPNVEAALALVKQCESGEVSCVTG